jgi:hypothetical protein
VAVPQVQTLPADAVQLLLLLLLLLLFFVLRWLHGNIFCIRYCYRIFW